MGQRVTGLMCRDRRWLYVCLAAGLWALGSAAWGGGPRAGGLRQQDSVWVVSSRRAGWCRDEVRLGYWQWTPCVDAGTGSWHPGGDEQFREDARQRNRTVIYVHGNRVSRWEARRRVKAVYGALRRQFRDDSPLQLVVWSWPTSRLRGGPLKDVRAKAQRARPTAYQLAWFIDRIDPDVPLGLIGFSLGSRVITGALHLLGGGRLGAFALAERTHPERLPVRAVLMASALDNDWLLPSRYHGRALSQVDRVLLLNNACDPAMRWYHLIDRCRRPQALGLHGLACPSRLGAERRKVCQRNVCREVGRRHDFFSYVCRPSLMQHVWRYLACNDKQPLSVAQR